MKEEIGDIWDRHQQGHWIVITTNGTVKKNGEAVMGRGLALQAKQRFPGVAKRLGEGIQVFGNVVTHWNENGLIFFPVKANWWEKADLELIKHSAECLSKLFLYLDTKTYQTPIYLPHVGCGNGGLRWADVKPILEVRLDDRFLVIERQPA